MSVSVQRRPRAGRGARSGCKIVIDCRDVAMLYEHFKYPLDHVRGRLIWEGDRVTRREPADAGRRQAADGQRDDRPPRPRRRRPPRLRGRGAADRQDAASTPCPPTSARSSRSSSPTGTVGGTAHAPTRTPPEAPGDDPRGKVAIDADLDLNERCGITWVGLPYPVNNLTGRLEIHPDLWEFKNMRGGNGQAVITGSGRVEKVGGSAAKPAQGRPPPQRHEAAVRRPAPRRAAAGLAEDLGDPRPDRLERRGRHDQGRARRARQLPPGDRAPARDGRHA